MLGNQLKKVNYKLLVINDTYTVEHLAAFAVEGIKYPKLNEVVELLRVIKYPRLKRTGFVVAPYQNQFMKAFTSGMEGSSELTFGSHRFVHLNGTPLSKEEIDEIRIKKELDKIMVPIKPNENERI